MNTHTTIIILETGEGREVNPTGPEPERIIIRAGAQYSVLTRNPAWDRWQAAESKLRTLPVEWDAVGSAIDNVKPGTRWKARLSDDKTAWVIEGRAE